MSELLAFSNVMSGYGDARIQHDVDLTIGDGERVAVLGRNGVGKTTIVNTFLGVARLLSGEVRLAGERYLPIRHFMAARRGIAVVPQGRLLLIEQHFGLVHRVAERYYVLSKGAIARKAISRVSRWRV